MQVVKRDGCPAHADFGQITKRIICLAKGLDNVDTAVVAQKVIAGVVPGITTRQLDELAMHTANDMQLIHPAYGALATRILVSSLHKDTEAQLGEFARHMSEYINPVTNEKTPLIDHFTYQFIRMHTERLEAAITHERDHQYTVFGLKTLMHSYLIRMDGAIAERPQHMLMRVAIGLHAPRTEGELRYEEAIADAGAWPKDGTVTTALGLVLETYALLSQGWFTHASPTLFNAGTLRPQMSSCFLLTMDDDSIEGIYSTLAKCAKISKHAGGIGLSVHTIRASGSYIRGTNGTSNGIVPMLRVFNNTARYVDQGGGKRKGAFAIYLEPWHADIAAFLDLKNNHGAEELRARDLSFGLWIPDLFMERVKAGSDWTLMCPNECPGLADVWGDAFNVLYSRYESEGRGRKTVSAQELWNAIMVSQVQTGYPYIMFKDRCNERSNQQNLGTIRSSNLCTEIIQYTSPDEVAVCNLASIALPMFWGTASNPHTFNFEELIRVVRVITRNLNRIIDINYYPIEEARCSNMRHRPIGIGVQGLADLFALAGIPFESEAARTLNRRIFATIYYAALTESCALAKRDGPYLSWGGDLNGMGNAWQPAAAAAASASIPKYEPCPAAQGRLQFDMWGVESPETVDGLLEWAALKKDIAAHGLRNSQLVAPMPTASTSQILGNNECIEPWSSMLYLRRTLAGEFVCMCKHLYGELVARGLWTQELKHSIMRNKGSIQNLTDEIPADLRAIYKTSWEIPLKAQLDMAADRGPYIDQSQSLNLHVLDTTKEKLTAIHFYTWDKGLKGTYYGRSKAAVDAIQFTVPAEQKQDDDQEPGGTREVQTVIKHIDQLCKTADAASVVSDSQMCQLEFGDDCIGCGS